jgi:Na+/H+-translocating membrane pyrophosphatase
MAQQEHPAVTRFREYLRINTMQPKPDYKKCVDFLADQASELGR